LRSALLGVLASYLALAAGLGAQERKDGLGDPLPNGAIQRLGSLRLIYGGGVSDCRYLPDGRVVVVTGGNIDIWDMEQGARLDRQTAEGASFRSVRCRNDGRALLLADSDGSVCVWDLEAKKKTRHWSTGQEQLREAVYSPDQKRALTLGALPPTLKEWEVSTGKQHVSIRGSMHCYSKVVYGPDGKTAWVGGGHEHVLEKHDLATGECLKRLFNDYTVYDMTVSADRRRVLVGSRHRASEWVMDSCERLKQFSGHHGHAVPSVAYCPNPDELLTGSRDGSVRRWNRHKGELLLRWFPHQSHVRRLRVSPDGKWVLSYGGGRLAESDVETGRARLEWDRHGGPVQAAAFLPGGQDAVSASTDGTLRVWNARSGQTTLVIQGANLGAYAAAVSPDGSRAAAGCKDSVVREFSLADGKLLRELKGHRGYVRAVVYSPDGKSLISAAGDGTAAVWNDGKTEPSVRLEGHRGGVLAVAVSPDGKLALTGGRDGTARVWELKSGRLLRTLADVHRGWVECAAFTAGGMEALSAGRDGRVIRWNAETGEVLGECVHGAWIRALAVSPDGRRVYSGAGNDVVCWDLAEGKKLATLSGHEGDVYALAVSADGKTLVSGSEDTSLLVWDVSGD